MKLYQSSANLYTHLTKIEDCMNYYKIKRKIEKLEQDIKIEKKEKAESAKNQKKSDHDEIRQGRIISFTAKMKKEFGIAVNQVKKAGHGASVENFNTTRKVLEYKNREKLVAMFVYEDEDEKFQFRILLRNLKIEIKTPVDCVRPGEGYKTTIIIRGLGILQYLSIRFTR